MKILALVTEAYGGYGGIAQYNRNFLNAASSSNLVQGVRVLPRIASESSPPHKVYQYPAVRNSYVYSARALQVCLQYRPDVIFNGHVYHGPLARRLAPIVKANLVSQLHGIEVWAPLKRRLMRPLAHSDLVLCVSEDTKKRYYRQKGSPLNAAIIHNTVGSQFSVGDRSEAKRSFGLQDEFVLLTVSRLDRRDRYKGHDQIIRALPRLLSTKPGLVYLIAGVGEDSGRLELLARELGVGSQVKFLGEVPNDILPELYRSADLFALPSKGEGFGIVFLEAMASGTPALGLNLGGAPDALVFPPLGMAVAPDDFETELSNAVMRSSKLSLDERLHLSAATHERFGEHAFSRNVEKVLADLVSQTC